MVEVIGWSASEIAKAVRDLVVSPQEVLEGHIQYISRLNPDLNAFVALCEEDARSAAKEVGSRAARREPLGPLVGVPVGIKDLDDVAGLPTTYGSVPFRRNVATRDSVHVDRLRRADALVLGKTNTPEFGYAAFTKNRVYGVTRNPWDSARTPGGSSGGSAAAVAAGLVPLATGTDRGGSLRIPASYTGCFTVKPTFGRVPRAPSSFLPWSDLDVIGPIARTPLDAALYLDVVSGHHPLDKDSLPKPSKRYQDSLTLDGGPLSIAWSEDLGYAAVERDVVEVCERAVRAFEDLGHRVEPIDADLDDPREAWLVLGRTERYAELAELLERDPGDLGRGFRAGVELGKDTRPVDLGRVQRDRARAVHWLADLFERYDVLVTPATPTAAFAADGKLPETIGGHRVEDPLDVVALSYPFNLTGHPAAVVPGGFVPEGLPVGLQLVAPHYREDLLLQVAAAYERVQQWTWPFP